jgi:branched-chain amino acid transport system ATP-binding protein
LLEVKKVDVFYGEVRSLWGISLKVSRAEIVSIVGSNAAGKTTTLNTISGILTPQTGEILFEGIRIDGEPPNRIVRRGVIQVPEGRKVFPQMTVLENLEIGAYNQRARAGEHQSLNTVLALFPVLSERIKQLAGLLSGGEQQMLAIGRGLMAQPKLLMLDEPSLGLAPMMVKNNFKIIKNIQTQGTTILLVEQNVVNALQIADRGYVLENGRIVMENTGKNLLEDESLKKAYLGI